MARNFQYQAKTEPVTVPEVAAAVVAVSIAFAEVIFPRSIIYQAKAEPVPVVEQITVDKWYAPLSEPVRFNRLATAHQQFLIWSGYTPAEAAVTAVFNTTITSEVAFPRSIIYQSQALPPQVAEVITEDKWHQSWSQPVLVKKPVTQQQFLAWSGHTPTDVTTEDKWHQPWSQPVRTKRLQTAEQQAGFVSVLLGEWRQAWSEPVRAKRLATAQQSSLAWSGHTPAAVTVSEDQWHQAWSQPVRVKPRVCFQQDLAWSGHTPAVTAAVFNTTVTSQVTFPRSVIYQSLAWCPQTISSEVNSEDKWHQAWSQPVRIRILATAQQRAHFGPEATIPRVEAVEPTTLASAVNFPRSIIYQSLAWCPRTIAAPAAVSYFPYVQGDTGLTFQKTIIYQVSAEVPETQIYWNNPWSEPVRRKNYSTALAQTVGQTSYIPVAAVTAIEPTTLTSAVIFPRSISYQSLAWCPQTIAAEVITEGKWHQGWSEPVRFKKALPVREQQTLAWCPRTITPETITEDKWHQAWSQPVRLRRLAAAQQKAYFAPDATIPTSAVAAIEPTTVTSSVVFPHSLIYQSLAWCPQTITPVATQYFPYIQGDTGLRFQKTIIYQVSAEAESPETHVHWYHPWDEPVRRKNYSAVLAQASIWTPRRITPESIFEDKWHQAWSQPVRIRNLATAQQRAHFGPEATIPEPPAPAVQPTTITSAVIFPRSFIYQTATYSIFQEVTREDKWHQAWSEPVRVRRLAVAQQQSLAWSGLTPAAPSTITPVTTSTSQVFPPLTIIYQSVAWPPYPIAAEVITEDKWHQAWSIPVKLKYQFRTDFQQSFIAPPIEPNLLRIIPWYEPLTEPVRLKKGLVTDLQQAFGTPPSDRIITRIAPWYAPLSEPVREKRGLSARFQQFSAYGQEPIAVPPVVVIIDATETNRDVASFLALVYNAPVRVYVSIKEVPGSDPTYASIEETD